MDEHPVSSDKKQTRQTCGDRLSNQPSALQCALAVISEHFPGFKTLGEATQLTGGYINYVWRIIGSGSRYPTSIIAKWFPGFVSTSPNMKLDSSRILFEANAMALFAPGARFSELTPQQVRPPLLYKLDVDKSVILMEDLGEIPNLGDWLTQPHTQNKTEQIGNLLGRFIGTLHKQSALDSRLAADFNNLATQQTRTKYLYSQIESYAALAGIPDSATLGRRASQLGQRYEQPGVCLIMGDLWPRSILVSKTGLRVFDWELAHFGRPSQDIAHLIAHLWMLAHRAPDAISAAVVGAVMHHFLKSYRQTIEPVFAKIWRIADIADCSVHFGCELFTRTVDAFHHGSLYSALAPSHPLVIEATRTAARHIAAPLDVDTFNSFVSPAERSSLSSAQPKRP